jgi:hypothetical protein
MGETEMGTSWVTWGPCLKKQNENTGVSCKRDVLNLLTNALCLHT